MIYTSQAGASRAGNPYSIKSALVNYFDSLPFGVPTKFPGLLNDTTKPEKPTPVKDSAIQVNISQMKHKLGYRITRQTIGNEFYFTKYEEHSKGEAVTGPLHSAMIYIQRMAEAKIPNTAEKADLYSAWSLLAKMQEAVIKELPPLMDAPWVTRTIIPEPNPLWFKRGVLPDYKATTPEKIPAHVIANGAILNLMAEQEMEEKHSKEWVNLGNKIKEAKEAFARDYPGLYLNI